jgi:hypothetical protein
MIRLILVVNLKLFVTSDWILHRRHNEHMTANAISRSAVEGVAD